MTQQMRSNSSCHETSLKVEAAPNHVFAVQREPADALKVPPDIAQLASDAQGDACSNLRADRLVGLAWLDGVDAEGNVNVRMAKARERLIRVFAKQKACSPYVFVGLLKTAGLVEIASGMLAALGEVARPAKKEHLDQPTFDFKLTEDID